MYDYINIDINWLNKIAKDNFESGKELLTKHKLSAWQLLHESLEKYLKIIYVKNNLDIITNKEDFHGKLKILGHDIKKIVNSLPSETKEKINKLFNTTPNLIIYKVNPLRFAEISFVKTNDECFSAIIELINEIEKISNSEPRKNFKI